MSLVPLTGRPQLPTGRPGPHITRCTTYADDRASAFETRGAECDAGHLFRTAPDRSRREHVQRTRGVDRAVGLPPRDIDGGAVLYLRRRHDLSGDIRLESSRGAATRRLRHHSTWQRPRLERFAVQFGPTPDTGPLHR